VFDPLLPAIPGYPHGSAPPRLKAGVSADWSFDEPERVNQWNALLRTVAAAHSATVRVVDLGGRLSPDGRFTMEIDGVTVRSDGVHLTPAGVQWLAPWLLPQLVHAQ
jgi:lysophospholipase L1-like esterase